MNSSSPWPTRLLIAALATSAFVVLPAASQAATTFGSRLQNDPANSGECKDLPTPCTLVSFIHPTDPDGDPYSGGAPVDGVITKFRTRIEGEGVTPTTVTLRLANISLPDPSNADVAVATDAGTGPTVTVAPGDGVSVPIREFSARLPVKKGNHLALDGTNMWATYNNSGNKFTYRFDPPLVAGQGPRGSNEAKGELLVAADIEPDADGDGFGDESQDQCPRQATTQGPCDDTKPGVSDLRVAGGKIRYTLAEAATVMLEIEKAGKGRKVGKKCKKQTRKNRKRKRCARYKKLGSLAGTGAVGANSLNLPKRLSGRKLGPGLYRLTLIAKDVAGNETRTTKTFRIAKKKKKKRRRG